MTALKYRKNIILGSCGLVVIVLGVVGITTLPMLISAILQWKLPLADGSQTYKLWHDVPLPLYFKAYMFNVTNKDAFLNEHAIPNVTEVGPYTFRLYWSKENISWNANNTISFRENAKYIFVSEMSVGDLSDKIFTLNAPMAVAGAIVRKKSVWERVLFSGALRVLKEELIIEKTVDELLFKGYYDGLNVLGHFIDHNLPDHGGYFSWFYGRNMSNDGLFNINTGKGNLAVSNIINSWNYEKDLNFWAAPSCNKIKGTNGEVNPPIEKDKKTIDIYRTDLCRSWPLTYEKSVTYFDIKTSRFSASSSVLANSSVNPDNRCFEPSALDPKREEDDLPSGAMDISPCQFGAPIVLSHPHFYQGDDILREKVHGMNPNGSIHGFQLDIEPVSGISLSLAARAQINVHIRSVSAVRQFTNVPDMVFPVLWQEITGTVTKELADQLKKSLQLPPFIMQIVDYVLIGVGLLMAIFAGLWAIYISSSYKLESCPENKPIINGADDLGIDNDNDKDSD